MSSKHRIYFGALIIIYASLVILHYISLNPIALQTRLIFVITMVTNLPLSYVTLETFLSVYYGRRGTVHKRVRLSEYPKTAVILGVYNDFSPDHFLESIRNNPGFDYWLLSDSNKDSTAMEKRVCAEYGIRYMHRGERRGKKAGAINDWATAHLKDYRYYLPLDKDSVLAENNVRDLLEIAEHPSNSDVAAFQSVIFSLSGRSLFSHLRSMIANIYLGQYPRNDSLALGEAIYWGHNALVRSEAYTDVGGQNELHLNEDISFTIKLREKGWKIAYVTEVVSYEEQPGDLPSDWERLARWMRGSYESTFIALSKVRKIGVAATWMIALSGLLYLSGVLLFLLVLITASTPIFWGNEQIGTSVSRFVGSLLLGHMVITLFVGPVLPFLKSRGAIRAVMLIILNTFISMPATLRATIQSIRFIALRYAPWSPTRLENLSITLKESFVFGLPEFLFGVLLFFFVYLNGNVQLLLQLSPWVLSFLATPVVVYVTSGDRGRSEGVGSYTHETHLLPEIFTFT